MDSMTLRHLAPRKLPRQARSSATLTAIYEATIQVLLANEPERLTTTRVAERAGVSVGTMYQYFPHKKALLFAVNSHFLDDVVMRVENACEEHRGATIKIMLGALIGAYWEAKIQRTDITRALYRSSLEFDNGRVIEDFHRRLDTAANAMFLTASDATYPNLALVNTTLLSVIFGTVRDVCQRDLPEAVKADIREQLLAMCMAYLRDARLNS